MAKLPEAVNGGMVTSKDPSMLQPGELAYAEMCIYTQDNDHLCRMPGVTTLDQLDVATSVVGLTSCRFEDGTNKLMAMASATAGDTYYWTANAEVNNPTFATAYGPVTLGERLVAVQYDNRHYLFNGANENLVYLKDGSFRQHGVLPSVNTELQFIEYSHTLNNSDPLYNKNAAVSATGYYEYWFTEVVKYPDGQEVESAFGGTPITVHVSSVAHAPIIKLPPSPANKVAYTTFNASIVYRVYRSEAKPREDSGLLYPVGRKIQDVQWLNNDSSVPTLVRFGDVASAATSPATAIDPNSHVGTRTQKVVTDSRWWDQTPGQNATATGSTEIEGVFTGGATTLTGALSATGSEIEIRFKPGATHWHDGVIAGTTTGSWANVNNIFLNNKTLMPRQYMFAVKDFGITPFSGNIAGISVDVETYASTANIADIYVMPCVFDGSGVPKKIPARGIGTAIAPEMLGGILPGRTDGPLVGDIYTAANGLDVNTALYTQRVQTITPSGTGAFATFVGNRTAFDKLRAANDYVQQKQVVNTTGSTLRFGIGNPDFGVSSSNNAFLITPHTWDLTDFNAEFGVQIAVRFRETAQRNDKVFIKSVKLAVHYTASSSGNATTTKYYDAVTLEVAGTQVSYGANGKPPIASTGAMFEGSLVTDAKGEPNKLYYSVPGYPDYFPNNVYWFKLPGVHNDRITYIGTINGRLVVGTRGNLWRINYLPSQDDASFQRGQAIDLISDSVGIVNPASACAFTNPNGQLELAFVDANGVYSTDGYSVRKLSQDLLWVGNNGVVPTNVAASNNIYTYICGLINDPRTQTLRLLTSKRTFIGSYAAIHAKQGGGLKWTTSTVYNRATVSGSDYIAFPNCIHSLRRANGTWLVTYGMAQGQTLIGAPASVTGIGGTVLREDSNDTTTFSQPFGYSSVDFPYIKTRAISPNGPGSELAVDGLCLHGFKQTTLGGNPTSLGCSVTANMSFTNAPPSTSSTTLPSVANAKANYAGIDGVNGEEVQFTIQMSDRNMFELHGIIMDASDFGEVDTSA